MKRIITASLSVLLVSAIAAVPVKAQTNAFNPAVAESTSRSQLTPFNLVSLAHRGFLKEEGIPSYTRLIGAYRQKEITAETLILAAINDNRLDPEMLNDPGYIKAVEAQLNAIDYLNP